MRYTPLLPALAVFLAVIVAAPGPVSAAQSPGLAAEPASVSLGETTTLTATGLGGLESATFGLSDIDAGAFAGENVETDAATAAVPVTDGTATVDFTPTRSGDVVVAVGTGESVLAQVTIAVEAATAEPVPVTAAPATSASSSTAVDDSAQAEPDSEAEAGRLGFVLIPLIAAAVVVVGGIVVITRGRRKRRGD